MTIDQVLSYLSQTFSVSEQELADIKNDLVKMEGGQPQEENAKPVDTKPNDEKVEADDKAQASDNQVEEKAEAEPKQEPQAEAKSTEAQPVENKVEPKAEPVKAEPQAQPQPQVQGDNLQAKISELEKKIDTFMSKVEIADDGANTAIKGEPTTAQADYSKESWDDIKNSFSA